MTVTAFMPVLNEEGRISRAISSLRQQTHPVEKLVVVDGGSTDRTHDIVESLAGEADFEIDLYVLEGAGVRYSSQFGVEKAIEGLPETNGTPEGVVLRLEGDSALEETFVETAVSSLVDESYSVFGAPVRPHEPDVKPRRKRFFTFIQNAERLPKGRAMAFSASDFYAVDGYRIDPEEELHTSDIDCLEDGILVAKLQDEGGVKFSHDTCVYSTVPSTTATSPSRWWKGIKIELKMGGTNYFTKIASPINKVQYAGKQIGK